MSKRRYKVVKLEPDDLRFEYGYRWDVAIETQASDGKYYYCGNGRYCRTLDEVKDFINKWEEECNGNI